jgi:hypothetical protein
MGALSFKSRFVDKVEAGLRNEKGGKRQSIRNFRKRAIKVGEMIYLYYAMRTKQCRKLGEAKCISVDIIVIDEHQILIHDGWFDFENKELHWGNMKNKYSTPEELQAFAQDDGFTTFSEMKMWWRATHGVDSIPYTGNLYKW